MLSLGSLSTLYLQVPVGAVFLWDDTTKQRLLFESFVLCGQTEGNMVHPRLLIPLIGSVHVYIYKSTGILLLAQSNSDNQGCTRCSYFRFCVL